MAKKHVQQVIDILDGPTRAARALKKSRQTMYLWLKSGRVPADEVITTAQIVSEHAKRKGIENPPTWHQLNSKIYPK